MTDPDNFVSESNSKFAELANILVYYPLDFFRLPLGKSVCVTCSIDATCKITACNL